MFKSQYNYFRGHTINIVLGTGTGGFAYVHPYPENTVTGGSGLDYSAALYLSEALHFNIK